MERACGGAWQSGGAGKLKRTTSSEKEKEKQAGEPHYLGARLLEGLKSMGTRWNGGVAENSELQQWRRRGS